jgi:hypothetical protein
MEDIELARSLLDEEKWNLIMLKGQGVIANSNNIVPYISNYGTKDLYPFENLAGNCQGPSQLFAALQSLFAEGAQ